MHRKKKVILKKYVKHALPALAVALVLMQKPQRAEALMPNDQTGTAQIQSGAISWDILGRSMILKDTNTTVTSVSKADAATLYSKDEAKRKYTSGHTYKVYANGERVIEESLYVEVYGTGNNMGWTNNAFRVTPANFDRHATVLGRSLLDNLYREGHNNNNLDAVLGQTSHAWLNGILTLRTNKWNVHSTMSKGTLWKGGAANYSSARQIHVTKKAVNVGSWGSQVKTDIGLMFEKKVSLPIIDDTAPSISASPNSRDWGKALNVTVSASDSGVGVKEMRTRVIKNGTTGAYSGWTSVSSKTVSLNETGSYQIEIEAKDRNNNSRTYKTGTIKVDVSNPTHAAAAIHDARYVSGTNYWFRPGDKFRVDLSGNDNASTIRNSYLRLNSSTNDNRASHDWSGANASLLNEFFKGTYTEIINGSRDYWSETARYRFNAKVKDNSSGQAFDVLSYYIDRVGNTTPDYVNTGLDVRVDGAAPTTSLTASNTTWKNTDQSVTLTMSDALSGLKDVRWRISQDDGGTWGAWTDREKAGASKTLNFNSNGRWRVQFQVRDNVDYNTNAEGRWFIDKSAPVLNLGGSPTSWTKEDVNLTWSLYDNGGSGFKNIKLPNGSFSTATSGTFAAGSNGTYSFTAYDNAGNSTTKSITVSLIDKVIPVHEKVLMHDFRYQDGNTYWYHEGDVARIAMQQADADSRIKFGYLRLYGDGNDNRALYNWVVNDNTVNEFQKTGGFTNISPNKADWYNISAIYIFNARMNATAINKTFQVHSYAEDNAGNTFGYTDTGIRVRTDSTPPTISPNTVPSGWINTNPTVTLTFADGQSGIKTKQYAWSTSTTTPTAWTNYTAPVTQAVAGTWYLHARATDNTGRQTVQRYGPYRIDKTAPTGIVSGNPTSWTNKSATLKIKTDDTGGSGYYRTQLPNGSFSTQAEPTFMVSENGTYTFVVYDNAGNSTTVTTVVTLIDTIPPTGIVTGNPTVWTNKNATLSLMADDSQSGVSHIVDHYGKRTNANTADMVVTENGTFRFTIYDVAGNARVINTVVTKIDKTSPSQSVIEVDKGG